MHVAYVGPVSPLRGGIAQHGTRVVEALSRLGHRVSVLSWAAHDPRRAPVAERDEAAEPVPGARYLLRWWNPASWWRAGRLAAAADVLVFPWITPLEAPVYLTVMLAARGTPAVFLVHDPLPLDAPRLLDRLLARLVLRRAAGAVVHAQDAVAQVARLAPRVPTLVVPHPPNLPVEPTDLPEGPPWRLLFFGYVRPYKGLDVALEAVALLVRRGVDVSLSVVGEFWGPVERWRERVARLGVDDRVTLRPEYVPDTELAELLASHHLVVAPYRSATQSGIVPVAYAAGRPVVSTDVGGIAEAVVEGRTGALAPPANPGAFADAVERAIERLPELAAGAREVGTSWADVAEAILDLGV